MPRDHDAQNKAQKKRKFGRRESILGISNNEYKSLEDLLEATGRGGRAKGGSIGGECSSQNTALAAGWKATGVFERSRDIM